MWKEKSGCLTLSFDCDYPQDVKTIPAVLRLLSSYSLKTTFACVGFWIEKYPDEHRMILEYGHEIMNHTYSHPDNELLNPGKKFKEMPRQGKKEEIERCHDICRKLLHYEPTGCRIPHFKNLFTHEIYSILKEIGYIYSSSTWLTNTPSHGMPFYTQDGILEFPLTTCPKHPFTVFDTWHSLNSKRWIHRLIHRNQDHYIELAKMLVDLAIVNNAYINIYVDPNDIVSIKRFHELLDYISERKDNLWIANYQDIIGRIKTTQDTNTRR